MNKKDGLKLIKNVHKATLSGLRSMPRNTPRTARQICGEELWSSLSRVEKIYAGRALSAFVQLRYLRLEDAGKSASNHRRYTLP